MMWVPTRRAKRINTTSTSGDDDVADALLPSFSLKEKGVNRKAKKVVVHQNDGRCIKLIFVSIFLAAASFALLFEKDIVDSIKTDIVDSQNLIVKSSSIISAPNNENEYPTLSKKETVDAPNNENEYSTLSKKETADGPKENEYSTLSKKETVVDSQKLTVKSSSIISAPNENVYHTLSLKDWPLSRRDLIRQDPTKRAKLPTSASSLEDVDCPQCVSFLAGAAFQKSFLLLGHDLQFAGAEIWLRDVAEMLESSGATVCILFMRGGTREEIPLLDSYIEKGLSYLFWKPEKHKLDFSDFDFVLANTAAIGKWHHFFEHTSMYLSEKELDALHKKTIYWIHEIDPKIFLNPFLRDHLPLVRKILFDSNSGRSEWLKVLPDIADKSEVIHPGIPKEKIQSLVAVSGKKKELQKKLDIPAIHAEDVVILQASTLSMAKGVDESIRGFEYMFDIISNQTGKSETFVGTNLYNFGGYQDLDHVTKAMQIYELQSNTWRKAPPLPQHAAESHHGITQDDRYIYVLSGQLGAQCSPPVKNSFVFDTVEQRWSEIPELPVARYAGCAGILNGRLHFVGGFDSDRRTPMPDHFSMSVKELHSWIANNKFGGTPSWRREEGIPNSAGHVLCEVLSNSQGSKFYFFGGEANDYFPRNAQDGDHTCVPGLEYNRPFVFSFDGSKWERGADMPYPISHAEGSRVVSKGPNGGKDGVFLFGGSGRHEQYIAPDNPVLSDGILWFSAETQEFSRVGNMYPVGMGRKLTCSVGHVDRAGLSGKDDGIVTLYAVGGQGPRSQSLPWAGDVDRYAMLCRGNISSIFS